MLGGYKYNITDPSRRPPLIPPCAWHVRRLPLSQADPKAAAESSVPQAPIPLFSNRIPLILLLLLNDRLRGPFPVRADRNPPKPLHLGHQRRRVPLHPLLSGHHPRSLRNERHRSHPRHTTNPHPPNTVARHAVRRTRGLPAEHDRLPFRRVTGQECEGARSLRQGRQQERERHFGVPHSQARVDDRPGCELRAVQTDERSAESWFHQPTGRVRKVPKPIPIIAPPPPEIRLLTQPSGPRPPSSTSGPHATSEPGSSHALFPPLPCSHHRPPPFRTLHCTTSRTQKPYSVEEVYLSITN